MSGVFSQADGAATRMSESVSSTNQHPPGSGPLPERESQLKMSRFAGDAVLDPAFAGALPVGIHVRAAADSSLFEWRRKPVAEFAGLHVWQVSTTKDGRSPPYLPGLSQLCEIGTTVDDQPLPEDPAVGAVACDGEPFGSVLSTRPCRMW